LSRFAHELTLVFGACAFASGFAMRVVDPLILPIG